MTELLVGTKKGLFVLQGDPAARSRSAARAFAGEPVEYAMRDPRSGRYFACVTSAFYGPKLFVTDDPAGEWQQAEGVALPEGGEHDARAAVVGRPRRGGRPALRGRRPRACSSRAATAGRPGSSTRRSGSSRRAPEWQPGAGGMCLHSIATWPGDPSRLALAISAVGVWLSDDGGATWRHGNKGLVPRYMPEEAREDTITLCVHNMHRAPTRPERLFMQFHGGVYRSDDAGRDAGSSIARRGCRRTSGSRWCSTPTIPTAPT